MAFSISACRRWSASSWRVSPLTVGDEGVIAVVGKQRQLGAGRGLHSADDESHLCGVRLALEGSVNGLGNIGRTYHPIGYGRPVLLRYDLDDIAQTSVLSDGDGEADIVAAADRDDVAGVEAAVGAHGERSGGSCVAYPADGFAQEVRRAPGGVGPSLAQPCHQHV